MASSGAVAGFLFFLRVSIPLGGIGGGQGKKNKAQGFCSLRLSGALTAEGLLSSKRLALFARFGFHSHFEKLVVPVYGVRDRSGDKGRGSLARFLYVLINSLLILGGQIRRCLRFSFHPFERGL